MPKCPSCRVRLEKESVHRNGNFVRKQYFCPECGRTFPIGDNNGG